ncbi:hypothetical protein D020_1131B, partial [Vibrio parahaemolyticus SBR10290]
LEKVNAAV